MMVDKVPEMKEQPDKAWISKYATTRGVFDIHVIGMRDGGRSIVGVEFDLYTGREWHRSEEKANADAIKRAKSKLAGMEKKRDDLICRMAAWGYTGEN